MDSRAFSLQLKGISTLGTFELRGTEYTGVELAMQLAINPNLPIQESARTPQLILEIGCLVAAAAAEAELLDMSYRHWRAQQVLAFTTDAGFALAHAASPKVLSKSAAEEATRALPGYVERYRAKIRAAEAHAVFHAAYEAAKSRQRALYDYENRSRGGWTGTPDEHGSTAPTGSDSPVTPYAAPFTPAEERMPSRDDIPSGPDTSYVPTATPDLAELETRLDGQQRSALPTQLINTGPPGVRPAPPPPPTRKKRTHE